MADQPQSPVTRRKPGPKRREAPLVVTTIRLEPRHWQWLRTEALRRAFEIGGRADASVVIRGLIDLAIGQRKVGDVSLLVVSRERLRAGLPSVSPSLLKAPPRRR